MGESQKELLKRLARKKLKDAARQENIDFATVDELVAEDLARRAEKEGDKERED